jgi:hypothetical protein
MPHQDAQHSPVTTTRREDVGVDLDVLLRFVVVLILLPLEIGATLKLVTLVSINTRQTTIE